MYTLFNTEYRSIVINF